MFKKLGNRGALRRKRRSSGDDEDDDGNGRTTDRDVEVLSSTTGRVTDNAAADDDDDDEYADGGNGSDLSSALESIAHATSTSSLLSFDHDEADTDVAIKVKKSSASRRLEKMKRLEKKEAKVKLRGVKEEDEPPPPSHIKSEPMEHDSVAIKTEPEQPDSMADVLTKLENEPRQTEDEQRDSPDASREDTENRTQIRLGGDDDENCPGEKKPSAAEDDRLSTAKLFSSNGGIPDAHIVYRARKQRQMARRGEIVPVDDTVRFTNSKSRLVREDDENDASDSDGDSKQPLAAVKGAQEKERRAQEDAFLRIEQGDSGTESDEELHRWESEQMRKGVSRQQVLVMRNEQLFAPSTRPGKGGKRRPFGLGADNGDIETIDMDVDEEADLSLQRIDSLSDVQLGTFDAPSIIDKMNLRLNEMESETNVRRLDLEKIESQLAEVTTNLNKLKTEQPNLQDKFMMFQEMMAFTREILDCLSSKLSEIEELEERMMALYADRADFVQSRGRQDIRDQFEQCSQMFDAAARPPPIDPSKQLRISEREGRRTRRRQARERTLTGLAHREGMSSDDEQLPSKVATFATEKAKIAAECAVVLSDVDDEFSSCGRIVLKLLRWLLADRQSFEDAFIALCLTKLLQPLVRLQLVQWNPLEPDAACLSSHVWFMQLVSVGLECATEAGLLSVADHRDVRALVPNTIDKVVIPKLTAYVRRVWLPMSSSQTGRLAVCVRSLVQTYPSVKHDCKTVQQLLSAINQRVRDSLDEDLFMPIYAQSLISNPASGAKSFLMRQFWSAFKLLNNVLLFDGVLADWLLREWVMDGIVNRHLVLGLQSLLNDDADLLNKCRLVVDALPAAWTSDSTEVISQPLANTMLNFARSKSMELSKGDAQRTLTDLRALLARLQAHGQCETLDQLLIPLPD